MTWESFASDSQFEYHSTSPSGASAVATTTSTFERSGWSARFTSAQPAAQVTFFRCTSPEWVRTAISSSANWQTYPSAVGLPPDVMQIQLLRAAGTPSNSTHLNW